MEFKLREGEILWSGMWTVHETPKCSICKNLCTKVNKYGKNDLGVWSADYGVTIDPPGGLPVFVTTEILCLDCHAKRQAGEN